MKERSYFDFFASPTAHVVLQQFDLWLPDSYCSGRVGRDRQRFGQSHWLCPLELVELPVTA